MANRTLAARRSRSSGRRKFFRPFLEQLETRELLSNVPILEIEPNDTIVSAQSLQALDNTAATPIAGNIGNGAASAADVDWYSFTLNNPAHVHLRATASDSSNLDAVLSLYNTDLGNTFDPDTMLTGHRMMVQITGSGGSADLQRDLAGGTYYVAISGKGNSAFYSLKANSGLPGQTGGYLFEADGTTIDTPPVLLSSDLDNVQTQDGNGNPMLDHSPLVFHFDTSVVLDPASDIHLYDANYNDLLFSYNISSSGTELQLAPGAALAPGTYQVLVNDANGNFLFASPFTISGAEGNTNAVADDTIGTAHDLGDISNGQPVQAAGAIGDDPFYDPINYAGDPNQGSPGNDVDIYHFQITGDGKYALAADVFAGRIGSSLDPAMTLFRMENGVPVVVAGNKNSRNGTVADAEPGQRPTVPFFTDPSLFAGLTAGDYYLAVSSGNNYADPIIGRQAGQGGVFDPEISHSGTAGTSTGNYILSLSVQPANDPPFVVSATVNSGSSSGSTVSGYPTSLDVQFSGPTNLQLLAFQAALQNHFADLDAVFITDTHDNHYVPRLDSYDAGTFTAHFTIMDRLPEGTYQLHLSGAAGLTDLSGTALAGSTPGGDFVTDFTVTDAAASGLIVATQLGHDTAGDAQDLGIIFGHEFNNHLTVHRDFTNSGTQPVDSADFYSFQVLQTANYSFFLSNASTDVSSLSLVDGTGNVLQSVGATTVLNLHLDPGTYRFRVDGWDSSTANSATYDLVFSLGGNDEHPTPLTIGPAPAMRLQLVSNVPLPVPAPPPPPPAPPVQGPGDPLPPPPPPAPPVQEPGDPPAPPVNPPPSQSPPPVVVVSTPSPSSGNDQTFVTTTATTDTATGKTTGLTNLPSGLAAALSADPVGGFRAPVAGNDNTQVARLNFTPSTFGKPDNPAGYQTVVLPASSSGPGTILALDTLFSQMGTLFDQATLLLLQGKDILFAPYPNGAEGPSSEPPSGTDGSMAPNGEPEMQGSSD